MQNLNTPEWDLDSEYPGLDSAELEQDCSRVQQIIQELVACGPQMKGTAVLANAQAMASKQKEAEVLLYNMISYSYLKRSTDLKNTAARKKFEQFRKISVKLTQSLEPLNQFVMRAEENIFAQFLDHPDLADSHFYYSNQRRNRERLLSLEQENLLSGLELEGFQAWGNLYTNLSGSIDYTIQNEDNQPESIGVARLISLLGDRNTQMRERAYRGLEEVFSTHQETCASILNALSGWRLEMAERRSQTVSTHFLTAPLHSNRMQQSTLDTMISMAYEHRSLGHKILNLQARLLKKPKLDPWDVQAPAPELAGAQPALDFNAAMDLIVDAFNEVDPSMGAFARKMQHENWIDAAAQDHKAPGAFCSGFKKSRTPRVLMTYLGSTSNLITLAHEIGHAFHSWTLREMPLRETSYPMSLAETASTFAETVVRQRLLRQAQTPEAKLAILWQEVSAIPTFLINLPVRYSFEKAYYEARTERSFGPADLQELMGNTWQEWYGDSMSENNQMFWATKMHFYITNPSFYNFPYSFGYLFSQGIYAERAKRGEGFFRFYQELLKDTGRMQVEDLVLKHFGLALDQPAFWEQCLQILRGHANSFEQLIGELGL